MQKICFKQFSSSIRVLPSGPGLPEHMRRSWNLGFQDLGVVIFKCGKPEKRKLKMCFFVGIVCVYSMCFFPSCNCEFFSMNVTEYFRNNCLGTPKLTHLFPFWCYPFLFSGSPLNHRTATCQVDARSLQQRAVSSRRSSIYQRHLVFFNEWLEPFKTMRSFCWKHGCFPGPV